MDEKLLDESSIIIRKGKKDDFDQVAEIWVQTIEWHAEFDKEFQLDPDGRNNFIFVLNTAISDPSQVVYVALQSNSVIGFVYGYIKKQIGFFQRQVVAHISDIAIKEEFRKKGVGRALMRRFENDFAKKNNADSLSLYVHISNDEGMNFYRKLGFYEKLVSMRKKITY